MASSISQRNVDVAIVSSEFPSNIHRERLELKNNFNPIVSNDILTSANEGQITNSSNDTELTTNKNILIDTGDDEVVLIPYGNGAKYLKIFRFNRNQYPQTILIGRNIETGLDKSCPNVLYVSRSHIAIHVKANRKIFISAIARQERVVSFNGRVLADRTEAELPIGSKFSLLGSIEWFNYVMMTASCFEQMRAPPIIPMPVPMPVPAQSVNVMGDMSLLRPPAKFIDMNANTNATNNNEYAIASIPAVASSRTDNNSSSSSAPFIVSEEILIPAAASGSSGNNRKRERDDIPIVSEDIPNNYRVKVEQPSSSVPPPAIVSSATPIIPPPSSSTTTGNTNVPKNVLRGLFHQFDCPICYETMASVCTLSPCGCNFCYHCIETWYCVKRKNQCPCCNQKFELPKSVANKRIDTVIREFLKVISINKDEIDSWEDRVLVGIQRRQAYYQLHVNQVPPQPVPSQVVVPQQQVQGTGSGVFVPLVPGPTGIPPPDRNVPTTAAAVAAAGNAPVTREVLSELIRARAIQVIAAASRPENANNVVLQGRAQRAQVVLAQLESQRQNEAAAASANGGVLPPGYSAPSTVAQWAASILPQPSIPGTSTTAPAMVPSEYALPPSVVAAVTNASSLSNNTLNSNGSSASSNAHLISR